MNINKRLKLRHFSIRQTKNGSVRDWVLSLKAHVKMFLQLTKKKKMQTATSHFNDNSGSVRLAQSCQEEESANTFLTAVDARLLFHTASHDRHRALPVTEIKRHQKAKKL